MFDFGTANDAQREAIQTTEGPLLIIAGPGTGKTYTLVQRAMYMIQEKGVRPENLFLATFTEKAAKELLTRLTDEMDKRGIVANVNEMYIGTFHSLCLRILKENLEYTRLKKSFRTLDQFDQQYLIYSAIKNFRALPYYSSLITPLSAWKEAGEIATYVSKLSEELVDPRALKADREPGICAMGCIMEAYDSLILQKNLLDFSGIQVETYHLLQERPEILAKLQEKITHFMIDEYQDTNYIQEQLVFLMAGEKKNICVVGDDDQGLYRFRGATIRNILEFPQKFREGEFKAVRLMTNYRSNSDIVDFYNTWMKTTSGPGFTFEWGKFRFDKEILPHKKSGMRSPGVIRVSGDIDWYEKVYTFIRQLIDSGKLTNLNQIAFFFQSVRNYKAQGLAEYLEAHGINVYAPRSNMYFQRKEVMQAVGCLLLLFPNYATPVTRASPDGKHGDYYRQCMRIAREMLDKTGNEELRDWIGTTADEHQRLTGTTDYTYSGLFYRLMGFSPFAEILDIELTGGVNDVRPARNLATLSQMINKYEYLYRIDVLSGAENNGVRKIDRDTERLFERYLRLLYAEGMSEYEDDSEYAPSGCVSFMTVHQSKGLEFPIVFVDSLFTSPKGDGNAKMMNTIEEKYYRRPVFEPMETTKFYDFWRLYYTAFSRAQDLLVLTWEEEKNIPSRYFAGICTGLTPWDSERFDIGEFSFHDVKSVNLKNTYSFTSHIAVYDLCALQYKFFRELGFMPVRAAAMLFGTLVHETIEDIHKAAMRHEEEKITKENVAAWFNANYEGLSRAEHAYLDAKRKEAALQQVLRYVERQHGDWSRIQQAEVDVSLVKPGYIIEGKIDLVSGNGDTVEIVDFKSQKKPDPEASRELIERYRRQLQIYSHLVEERTGKMVSRMHIYYTADDSADPRISFDYDKDAVDRTMSVFDETVTKIQKKDFSGRCANPRICDECDFRHYCRGKE